VAGFGRSKFGKGPFGRSDTGRDLIIELFPVEYLQPGSEEGVDPKKDETNELYQVLKTISNSVAKRRREIETLNDLTDYERAPSEILLLIGEMLGLGLDKNDPLFLQRSFVGNASQWLQIKSSKKGYSVRGLASGFQVTVQNYWRVNPIYLPLFPFRNRIFLKPVNADPSAVRIFHTDLEPGTLPGTPTEEGEDYAKSSYLKVIFEIAEPRRQGFDYNKLLDLIIDKIQDVVAIHHEIGPPEFRITMNIDVDFRGVDMLIHENIEDYPFNVFSRYDIVPADVQPCDFDEPIVLIIGGPTQNNINVFVNPTFEKERISEELLMNLQAAPQVIITNGIDVPMAVYVNRFYDVDKAADELPTDEPIFLNMDIQINQI